MSKSPEKKSEKKSKGGGKSKKVSGRQKLPELTFLSCAACGTPIDPTYVWYMETVGDGHAYVLVTHHCICCRSSHDIWVTGRYEVRKHQYGLAYLMGFDNTHIHYSVNGGWTWESPAKQYVISAQCPDVVEFRDVLNRRCHTVEDFIRLTGRGWPDAEAVA